MTLCIRTDGAWTTLPYGLPATNADGIQASYGTLMLWSEDEREAFGVFEAPEPDPPPAGKVEAARALVGEDRPAWKVEYREAPGPGVPFSVSETQFMRAATRVKLVKGSEAEDYLARGVIPAFVAVALDGIKDEAARIDARLKIVGATVFFRADALFTLLIGSGVATADQVDDLFRLADTLD